jgi:hypothetical protein
MYIVYCEFRLVLVPYSKRISTYAYSQLGSVIIALNGTTTRIAADMVMDELTIVYSTKRGDRRPDPRFPKAIPRTRLPSVYRRPHRMLSGHHFLVRP